MMIMMMMVMTMSTLHPTVKVCLFTVLLLCDYQHCLIPSLGAVASWSVCSSPDQGVWVRGPAGDIVLTLYSQVPLSTQVYKWVPVNLMLGCDPAMD